MLLTITIRLAKATTQDEVVKGIRDSLSGFYGFEHGSTVWEPGDNNVIEDARENRFGRWGVSA